eukprot:7157603-Prymnesium_polylepis.3
MQPESHALNGRWCTFCSKLSEGRARVTGEIKTAGGRACGERAYPEFARRRRGGRGDSSSARVRWHETGRSSNPIRSAALSTPFPQLFVQWNSHALIQVHALIASERMLPRPNSPMF